MAVSVVSFAEVANWFVGSTPRTFTGVSWSAGDVLAIVGGRENSTGTISVPTNANLTFVEQASILTGTTGEAAAYLWSATAATAQTGQTISITGSTGTNWGLALWVFTGTSGSVANASANRTEAGYSVNPAAGSAIVYYLADWNANATTQTLTTGSGTATKRVDNTDSATYANVAGEWVGVNAGSNTYGVTDYTGLQVGHVIIEIAAAATESPGYSVARMPGRIGPDGKIYLPRFWFDTDTVSAATEVTADTATLVLSGVDAELAGTGASSVTADVATLAFVGVDATLAGTGSTNAPADTATLTFSGVDAVLSSGGSNVTVDPATLTFAGVDVSLAGTGASSTGADVAVLVLSGVDITVSAGANITADTAILTLSGVTPVVSGTGTAAVIADTATLTFAGTDCTLAGVGAVSRTADPAVLILTGVEVGAFSGQVVTPASRTYVIPVDPRTLQIGADTRTWTIPADQRTLTVPAP